MAISDENGSQMVMPVGPIYGNGNQGGFGFGGDWAWILLLLVLFGGNGWGNGFGGGFGGGELYPWMNQAEITTGGFRDQMLNSGITGLQSAVTSGFGDVQTALCGGFAGTTAAITGAQNALAQQMYTNQISDLERSFAAQTASTQGITALQSQLASCCCDNRAGLADLRYTVATEACADRAAVSDALRDVIAANTASTQRILDQLCNDKIEAKNDEIARLRQELNMQSLAASQAAQNAFIQQGFSTEVDALYNRLNSCPVPTTPVYGRTPIFTCGGGCGCGNSGLAG